MSERDGDFLVDVYMMGPERVVEVRNLITGKIAQVVSMPKYGPDRNLAIKRLRADINAAKEATRNDSTQTPN